MQGKGVIKFFLVVMTIVALVQYFFIVPTNTVEENAEEYALKMGSKDGTQAERAAYKNARTGFLDSMSSEKILSIPLIKDYTYQELKAQQLNLGLDLKGGMSVVLQVDLRAFIEALTNSKDPKLISALNIATQNLKNAQADYVTLFGDAWSEQEGDKTLYALFRKNDSFSEKYNLNNTSTDGDIVRAIREEADETVDLTFKMLKQRIDKMGVAQPNVTLDDARDLIVVELPGIDNPQRARKILQATAKLEFWKVFRTNDASPNILQALDAVNTKLKSLDPSYADATKEIFRIDTIAAVVDSLGNEVTAARVDTTYNEAIATGGPLFDILSLANTGGATVGYADKNKRKAVTAILAKEEVKTLLPSNLRLLWGRNPVNFNLTEDNVDDTPRYALYALNVGNTGESPLQGDLITGASAQLDAQAGEMAVSLSMNQKGAQVWSRLTNEAYSDQNRQIAIVLDDEVVSAPTVNSPINDGRSSISGNFTAQEAGDLANILEIGKLPAGTQIIQDNIVGPSLGADNISRSISAMVGGLLLVLVFMIAYYGSAGIVSIIALFMNLFFIFGALASLGTVLTVPGIAGIILTIGMAVDANVIIYERIREELREGKSLRMAVHDGFSNSYSAIIDANVTTILVAMVLYYFGLGPIKGFAAVLMVGVFCSVFTAVLVGRLIIDWWIGKGNNLTFWTGFSKNAFSGLTIDWLGKRKTAYVISSVIILLGVGSMLMRGFDLGVDFQGGYSYNVEFAEGTAPDAEAVRQALAGPFGSTPTVKSVDGSTTLNILTSYMIDSDAKDASSQVIGKLHEGINAVAGGKVNLTEFSDASGKGTHITASSKVGPTIADDIKTSSLYAAIFSLLLIFLYIFIRFSKWQYSLGAVAALFHDVLVVLGIFSLLHGFMPFTMEIDQAFIAAILTVIGYSINDTVVVFDRVREFMGIYTGLSKEEIINKAINSTVSRTVITSLTTMFVVLILFVFGGGSIKGFAFALLIGIIVGTYSSIFVATPIMSDSMGDLKAREKTTTRKSFSDRAKSARPANESL
ncbi:MAG: SecD/SecF fusion protein [Paraglaciecola sp.]|jgi:SecD/SecF fusion protein